MIIMVRKKPLKNFKMLIFLKTKLSTQIIVRLIHSYIKTKNKKEEEVVEVAPSTIKFLDMGDRGHQQIAAQYNMSQLPGDVYNSPDVYDNNVGGEQVDGS